MSEVIAFIAGLFIGAIVGILSIAICNAGKNNDLEDRKNG